MYIWDTRPPPPKYWQETALMNLTHCKEEGWIAEMTKNRPQFLGLDHIFVHNIIRQQNLRCQSRCSPFYQCHRYPSLRFFFQVCWSNIWVCLLIFDRSTEDCFQNQKAIGIISNHQPHKKHWTSDLQAFEKSVATKLCVLKFTTGEDHWRKDKSNTQGTGLQL